jgi:hypothetical protein
MIVVRNLKALNMKRKMKVAVYFQALPLNLPGGNEENHVIFLADGFQNVIRSADHYAAILVFMVWAPMHLQTIRDTGP